MHCCYFHYIFCAFVELRRRLYFFSAVEQSFFEHFIFVFHGFSYASSFQNERLKRRTSESGRVTPMASIFRRKLNWFAYRARTRMGWREFLERRKAVNGQESKRTLWRMILWLYGRVLAIIRELFSDSSRTAAISAEKDGVEWVILPHPVCATCALQSIVWGLYKHSISISFLCPLSFRG